MLAKIEAQEIVLNQIIKYLSVHYRPEFISNELIVEIDEGKLINMLSNLTNEYKKAYESYTGNKHIYPKKIDRIVVKLGDYSFSAVEEFELIQSSISKGFKKETR